MKLAVLPHRFDAVRRRFANGVAARQQDAEAPAGMIGREVEPGFVGRRAVQAADQRGDRGAGTVVALRAARLTGAFRPPAGAERSSAVCEGLDAHDRLQRGLTILRAKAAKKKQINRQVELNLEIKRLEAELAATAKIL